MKNKKIQTEQKEQKKDAAQVKMKDGQIVGFQRGVPVLLCALGVFIGLCFISGSTGIFGTLITQTLLGLFSWAAYFLPFLLILHAVFYIADIKAGRRLSRLIFTVATIVAIASLIHAFTYIREDFVYNAAAYFENGKACVGGGFIGGSIAFLIKEAFGHVGLIVITLTVFALYITFFITKEHRVWRKLGISILSGFLSCASAIERGILAIFRAPSKRKKDKKKKNSKEQFEALYDDDYILSNNSRLSDMEIPQLGIAESHGERPISQPFSFGKTPTDAVEDTPPPHEEPTFRHTAAATHGTSPADNPFATGAGDPAFDVRRPTEGTRAQSDTVKRACANETADEVFGQNFTSFDLAMNLRLSEKLSSRTAKEQESGIREYTESLEEEIARAEKRRREEEFERKKQASISYMQRTSPEAAHTKPAGEASYTEPARETGYAEPVRETGYTEPVRETSYTEPVRETSYTDPVRETGYTEPVRETSYAEPVRETGYTEPVRETSYAEPVREATAAAPSARKESMTFTFSGTQDTRPSASEPSVDTACTAHLTTEGKTAFEASHLTVERTLLDPAPHYEADEVDTDEDEEEIYTADMPDEEQEDTDGTPIPPEEQNPAVRAARDYFPLLRDEPDEDTDKDGDTDAPTVYEPSYIKLNENEEDIEDGEDEETDGYDEEEDDEDLPPFDMPTAIGRPTAQMPTQAVEESTGSTFVEPDYSDYVYPPIDLLTKNVEEADENMEEENRENADKLHNTLSSFGVVATVRGYDRGPRITRFEIVPAQGTRVNKVTSLFDDITLALAAKGIRMEAPIPGKRAIGVEIPNKKAQTVRIRDLIEDDEFSRFSSKTIACIGKDVTGNPVYGDIAKMPHLLVAGATGMGKSVSVNSMLISILFRARPDEVKLIIFDPKKVDFQGFNGIPHLLVPVVTEAKQAAGALMWAVEEMEKRFTVIEKAHVKKIDDYNAKVKNDPSLGKPMPKIIIVIDELNDLMLQVKNPVETLIMRIAQKARAAGIHLIVGTQRPSVNVLTGVIKANIPSRMSCKVASNVDSRTVLEVSGAEKLLNNGDMLYYPVGSEAPMRVQGAFVSDEEMEAVMDYLRTQAKGEIYDPSIIDDMNRATQKCSKNGEEDDGDGERSDGADGDGILNDPKFLEAADIALSSGKISTALLQRRCSIGYGRAAKYIDYMQDLGLVSEPNGQKPRDVLLSKQEWNDMLDRRSLT